MHSTFSFNYYQLSEQPVREKSFQGSWVDVTKLLASLALMRLKNAPRNAKTRDHAAATAFIRHVKIVWWPLDSKNWFLLSAKMAILDYDNVALA